MSISTRRRINKIIRVDLPIVGDVGQVLEDLLRIWKSRGRKTNAEALRHWWGQIGEWQARNCLSYKPSDTIIKPQYALQRLEALTEGPRPLYHDRGRPAPDVGGAVSWLRRSRTAG